MHTVARTPIINVTTPTPGIIGAPLFFDLKPLPRLLYQQVQLRDPTLTVRMRRKLVTLLAQVTKLLQTAVVGGELDRRTLDHVGVIIIQVLHAGSSSAACLREDL
ncbi:hypothetical protein ASF69_10305 [Rhizobium sp. Leaf311]|uniref:hypothetical protein n=1 Tax=Rhizobium sp. Leaf311 TaxID=1736332 RepID=UPI0007147FB4|nr:hypothetical protein [Rhizobium sp. Leaf311]KQQ59540.1 hypothetical protein ASF69_10305 [Rhizobium sp. Leaf311]